MKQVIIIIIIILVIFFILKNKLLVKDDFVEPLPNFKINRKMNIAIILTMYTKDKERADMYYKNLKKWSKSGFDIYCVESNGYKYDIPGIEYLVFNQDDTMRGKSTSIQEKNSIQKIYNYFKSKFIRYDFIFKVTGKYYIKNLYDVLDYIPYDTEVLLQNNTGTYGQNSEIMGAKPTIFFNIVNQINGKTFEQTLYDIAKSKKYKTYRLQRLYFDDKVQRSDGSYLDFL